MQLPFRAAVVTGHPHNMAPLAAHASTHVCSSTLAASNEVLENKGRTVRTHAGWQASGLNTAVHKRIHNSP
jgi:hypothetical protein